LDTFQLMGIAHQNNQAENNHQEDEYTNNNSINSYDLLDEMSILSNNQPTISKNSNETDSFIDQDCLQVNQTRAATAPAKPINEAEEFKWGVQFVNLEKSGKNINLT